MSEIPENNEFIASINTVEDKISEELNDAKKLQELIWDLNNNLDAIVDFNDENPNSNNKVEISEMYNDFLSDINQIIQDGVIDSIEAQRLQSIQNILDASAFSVFWIEWDKFNEIADEDIADIKSIKQLVYSRNTLDKISWEGNVVIEDLKTILGLIENVWSSNIDDQDLIEINQLITDIFDEGIDKSDIQRLQKLQMMLLFTYNVEQNQKFENFSLDKNDIKPDKLGEVNETRDLLNILAELDNEYGDMTNEMAPTIWNFLDSIAVEVKDGLIEWDWNTLWASLRLVLKQFWDLKQSFDNIDFSDPMWSSDQILDFQMKIMWFDKFLLTWNTLNLLRHIIPRSIWLLFTWIKEIKNYYIQSTWPETQHGVLVQSMHMYRDEIKDGDYAFDWLKEWASVWAESVDNSIVDLLSVFNWWSDAVLDFSGVLLNTLFLPEKTVEKISDTISGIDFWDISNWLENLIPDTIDQELVSKCIYMISYISMYICATTVVPWLWWANNHITKLLNDFSRIVGKPIKDITNIVEKWLSKVTQTEKFQKLNKLVWEWTKVNDISKKAANNTKGVISSSNTSQGFLNNLDKASWKISRFQGDTNRLQSLVDHNINKTA